MSTEPTERNTVSTATGTLVHLAGALGVEREGRRATERDLPGRQPRLTFTALVWDHGSTIPHEALAEILWPEELPASWQPALRGLVSKVRGVWDLVGLDGASVVASEAGRYRLVLPPGTTVDVEAAAGRVAEAARVLEAGGVQTARRLASEARTVLSRPLLAGIDSPWLDRRRDELGALLARCLEVLGESRRRAGEPDHAAQVIEELLRRDPFREPAWRLLMRIHAEAGNVAEALRTYERCRALLADELGADPSPETRKLHLRLLQGAPAPGDRPAPEEPAPAPAPTITGPPYRGLRHFDEDDAPVFFGREGEIRVLLERLRDHRFVAVVGPSGSGKSSLVRAGLLPALASGALPDADTWRRIVLVPGSRPLGALSGAVLAVRSDGAVRAAVGRLGHDEAALQDAASALLGDRSGERLLLVIDQFEEVFTVCRDEEARRRFIAALLSATRPREARVVVVLTLRADFYGRAAAYPELAAALSTSHMLVAQLDGDGLQLAVEGPARLAGLRFEDGLVGRILADIAGEPGALPLLQHALLELYERRSDHVLTRGAYEDIGGASGALARHAEDLWGGLTGNRQAIVRQVLLRLTEPGEGTEDTRRRALMEELVGDPETAAATEAVVDELAQARLVVTSADPATEARSVEIAHEALLRRWPRLARWIDEDRAGLHLHRRLTGEAQEWEGHHRHPDFLLSGARLAEVRGWAAEHEADLNPLERAFLRASVETEEASARRRRRLRRFLTAGLAAGLVIVGVLALVASAQRGRANREADLAHSREVAAEAVAQLDIDPEVGLLLAMEAYEIAPTVEAEAALRQALVRSTVRHRLPTEGPDPLVQVGADGALVATAGIMGPIVIWDAAIADRLAVLTDESDGFRAAGLAFSPDGTRLVATDLDGAGWIWSLPDGDLVATPSWRKRGQQLFIVAEEGAVWSPDGSRVLLAGVDGRARMFDAASGELLATFRGPESVESQLARARFTPDGRRVAVEGAAGAVRIIDVATEATLAEMRGHESHLWGMKFSADGTRLVTASEDGTARIWDVVSGEQLHVLRHDATVRDAAVSGDGTRVLTGDAEGVARIWDAASGDAVLDLVGHEDRINQVRFDSTGSLALTASIDGTARVWDVASGGVIAVMTGSTEAVADAELSPEGDFVFTGGDDARIWRVPEGAVSVLEGHEAPVYDLALSADGNRLATGGVFDGVARTWDLDANRELAATSQRDGTITYVDISHDGTLAVAAASYLSPGQAVDPDPVRVWDAETGEVVAELPLPDDDPLGHCGGRCAATEAAFSPDSARVAVGGFDGRVRVFDARTGELLLTTEVGEGQVNNLEWSPEGGTLLIGYGGTAVHPVVRDSATGEVLHDLPREREGLTYGQIAFGPDGHLIATTSGSTARIYEVGSQQLVAQLRHRGAAHDVAFSPDGSLVVTASGSGAAIWDVASQRRLTDLAGVQGAFSAAFTADGEMIAVGGADGTVRFYECEVCQPVDRLLRLAGERVTRDLTPDERARFLHEV